MNDIKVTVASCESQVVESCASQRAWGRSTGLQEASGPIVSSGPDRFDDVGDESRVQLNVLGSRAR